MDYLLDELFGLTDITPVPTPAASCRGSPEPEPPFTSSNLTSSTPPPTPSFVHVFGRSELPKKRHPSASPETSPARVKGAAKKRRRRDNRQNKRKREKTDPIVEGDQYGYTKHVKPSVPLATDTGLNKGRVGSSAYTGLDDKNREQMEFTLADVIAGVNGKEFKLLEWDGKSAIPITDPEDRVIAVLVGMPNTKYWRYLMQDAAGALEQARRDCDLKPEESSHRRGEYFCLRTGVSIGGGQKMPMAASNTQVNDGILARLNGMECFKRLASFTTCEPLILSMTNHALIYRVAVLKTWSPRMHKLYASNRSALEGHHRNLNYPFEFSVFPSVTYNLGPRTVTFPHLDFLNLAYGWCAITALGNFDYKRGGHLILWDLGLVIEFPPGATILIPSAIISHSNLAISLGESRYSVTQYAAGGLFRWVDNGFKSNRSLSRKATRIRKIQDLTRWEEALSVFRVLNCPTLNDIKLDGGIFRDLGDGLTESGDLEPEDIPVASSFPALHALGQGDPPKNEDLRCWDEGNGRETECDIVLSGSDEGMRMPATIHVPDSPEMQSDEDESLMPKIIYVSDSEEVQSDDHQPHMPKTIYASDSED